MSWTVTLRKIGVARSRDNFVFCSPFIDAVIYLPSVSSCANVRDDAIAFEGAGA